MCNNNVFHECFVKCIELLETENYSELQVFSSFLNVLFVSFFTCKLVQYVSKQFFVNKEIKDNLKTISLYAERHKSVVLFEL